MSTTNSSATASVTQEVVAAANSDTTNSTLTPAALAEVARILAAAEQAKKEQRKKAREEKKNEGIEKMRNRSDRPNPNDWVFVAGEAGWYRRKPNGALHDDAKLIEKSIKTLLQLSDSADDPMWSRFTEAAYRVDVRRPVFNARLGQIITIAGQSIYNTYERADFLPEDLSTWEKPAGSWDDYKSLFLNLAGGDEEGLKFQLGWYAAFLRAILLDGKPIMMRTALVYWGEHGSGKGTVGDIMATLLHSGNILRLDQSRLENHFTSDLDQKLFCIVNEASSGGDKITDKVKGWVTDPDIIVEKKKKDAITKRHQMNFIWLSNRSRPVNLESDSQRRFSVFHSPTPLEVAYPGLAERIHKDLEGEKKMLKAFVYHLLKELPAEQLVRPGQLLKNEATLRLIRESKASQLIFFDELLAEGYELVSSQWKVREAHRTVGKTRCAYYAVRRKDSIVTYNYIPREVMYEVYQVWCTTNGQKSVAKKVFDPALVEYMTKKLGPTFEEARLGRKNEERYPCWVGIPIGVAQEEMEGEEDQIPFSEDDIRGQQFLEQHNHIQGIMKNVHLKESFDGRTLDFDSHTRVKPAPAGIGLVEGGVGCVDTMGHIKIVKKTE